MSDIEKKIHRLTDPQMLAVQPDQHIWLSAAAGTGKTQVLSARVLRLLLQKDVRPEDILCITFTKAGAAEMANRINKRLASWVRMKGTTLAKELDSIGADHGPETQNRARQLFAALLDAPGGGLRVMTIHSFCQTLLSSFPSEAALNSGFRAIEEREQALLFRDALNLMCEENAHDETFIAALEELSLLYDEQRALNYLQKWARNPAAAAFLDRVDFGDGTEKLAQRIVGCTIDGDPQNYILEACQDENFNISAVRACAELNADWGGTRGLARAENIAKWLGLSPKQRANDFDLIHSCWSKDKGTLPLINSKGYTPADDSYEELVMPLFEWTSEVQQQMVLHGLARRLAANFLVGKNFAQYYQRVKEAQGLVDFDDLIRKSAALLNGAKMADWIRYKLDQRIDHILIDEAQDTNQSQWDIIKAISDDFYSGAVEDDKLRTIFTVGDFKQAIFGFQGTSPQNYANAQQYFDAKLKAADLQLNNLLLFQSFRSTKPILDFVNKMIEIQGHSQFGLEDQIEDHFGQRNDIGEIILLQPVKAALPDETDPQSPNDNDDEETWMSEEKRILADKLADHIKAMIDDKIILDTTGKAVRPSDIMVLLRSRSELASLIIARLYAKNIPVAGIDRLYLSKPLAVQDLLTMIKFVLQPDDDLNLATLLTSPLIGLNHDQLLAHGYRKQKISLWQHIRRDKALDKQVADLRSLLDMADYGSPYQFLEQILSGPLQGRKKLYSRLGFEAEIAINELLNSALEYSRDHVQSLQGFLEWTVRGDVEIKRENSGDHDEVRVMTVHGSKGLQAPIVILADICANPTKSSENSFDFDIGDDIKLPIPSLDKNNRIGKIGDAWEQNQKRELEEHNRLLYVALTRSEERLILAGSLGKRSDEPHEKSWHHPLKIAMDNMGAEEVADDLWGMKQVYSKASKLDIKPQVDQEEIAEAQIDKDTCEWLFSDAPQESRPPKPLAPSRIFEDDAPTVPLRGDVKKYALRGQLIHNLFEFLTSIKSDDLQGAAMRWFTRQHNEARWKADDIIDPVITIMTNPKFSNFFGANSRSEVPIAAVVGEIVVNGRIDQLVVGDDEIIALDYKTGSKVPQNIDEIPTAYMRQMAHYVAALEIIFPGKLVQSALLYTNGPQLYRLSDDDIAAYRPKNQTS